jgi:hypothetical protein
MSKSATGEMIELHFGDEFRINGLPLPFLAFIRNKASNLVQPALVEGHAYCGVDAHLFENIYFPLCPDAARGDDRMRSDISQLLEPLEIDSGHRSFAIYVGAKKCSAERLKLLHNLFRLNLQFFTPAFNYDMAFGCVQRHDNCGATDLLVELAQKWRVHLAILECGAADNDLMGAPLCNFLSATNSANAPADAHFHSKAVGGFAAQSARQFAVVALPHGSIQIDDVQPFVHFEFQ